MFVGEGRPFPTLFELAKRVCIRNVNGIDDVGDLPYSRIRPILLRLENPTILRTIEQNSPQLCSDTAELWHTFIRRDIGPSELEEYISLPPEVTENMSWSKLYFKLKKKKEEKEQAQIEELKAEMQKCYDKKEKRQIGFANVRRQDVAQLRGLDKGWSGGGGGGRHWSVMSGRVSRESAPKPFRSSTLNKVLMKGPRR